MNADFGRLAAFHLVPFGGNGDQFTVTVAARDIGQHGRWQDIRLADFLAALFDRTLVGKLAQDSLQLGAIGVFEAEFTSDLAGPDLSRMRADESDDGVCGRKALSRCLATLSACLARALLGDGFWFCRLRR